MSENTNDIALLRLNTKERVRTAKNRIPKLCSLSPPHGIPLASCGLGTISRSHLITPSTLREIYLSTSLFRMYHDFDYQICPEDAVCTVPLSESNSSICFMDEGNPLYVINCDQTVRCLVGVASYYQTSGVPGENCKGGSYFASVPFQLQWINSTINNYTYAYRDPFSQDQPQIDTLRKRN